MVGDGHDLAGLEKYVQKINFKDSRTELQVVLDDEGIKGTGVELTIELRTISGHVQYL
jgi:hypothetical protein